MYAMKRPPKRKVVDVSAAPIASAKPKPEAGAIPNTAKDFQGAAMADEAAHYDPYDDEVNEAIDYDLDDDADLEAEDSLEEEGFIEDTFWGEDLEAEAAEEYRHSAREEFDLGLEDDPMAALFAEERSGQPNIRAFLEQGMVKALAANQPADFWEQALETVDEAINTLRAGKVSPLRSQPGRGANGQRRSAKRNGHRPELKRQILAQPVTSTLRELAFLMRRYAKRGLSELDALEDGVELLAESGGHMITPVLAGLAARAAIQPKLAQSQQQLPTALRRKLVDAAQRSIGLLTQEGGIQALPGLAASVGQHALRQENSLSRLPKDFYQAATRLAANPGLQERLANFALPQPVSQAFEGMPMRLRVEGPLEIVIQKPQGE
jgi:hypothetical protein